MEQKKCYKYFRINEFEVIQNYLQEENKNGWKLSKICCHRFYFEKDTPNEYIYQIDCHEGNDESYTQMFEDYGWELMFSENSFYYFRKLKTDEDIDLSIFSDKISKADFCKRMFKNQQRKLIPFHAIVVVLNFFILFTNVGKGHTFLDGFFIGLSIILLLFAVYKLAFSIPDSIALNKIIRENTDKKK